MLLKLLSSNKMNCFSRSCIVWIGGTLLLCLNVGGTECRQCQYDGKDDVDCRDYGLVDNTFVPWYTGSQDCKDSYDIKISSPNVGSICASANSFVNDIRFGFLSSSDARLGLGVSSGDFFEQDSRNGNKVVLNDSITIGGTTTNCQTSESSCYNAMKPYFDKDLDGKKEMEDVCDTLFHQVRVDRQLEESILRGRLCMETKENTGIPSSCDPLWSQLEEIMSDYPDKTCGFFQMGTEDTAIPGCGNKNIVTKSKKHVFADAVQDPGSILPNASTTKTNVPTGNDPDAILKNTKQCAYLIENVNSYDPTKNAFQPPIDQCHEMSEDSKNQECEKCCSYSANEMIKDGMGGGFSVEYTVPVNRGQKAESEEAAICYAYVDALHDTLCSPYQGNFISNSTFRIAQESCNLVYQNCVPTGIISSAFAGNNGTTFCHNAWSDPCSKSSNGYPCQAGIELQVVTSNAIGITILQPTHVLIIHYEEESTGTNPWKVSSIVAYSFILLFMLCVACCCFSTSI